jgi:putative IMPACT (imprinted ancient) family translation regulator
MLLMSRYYLCTLLIVSFVQQVGDQYRSNDDGEPSGTAGKPIYSAIATSGIDRVMVVVIRLIL